jgi:hypothetical protein
MRGPDDIEELRQRMMFAPNERARTLAAAAVGLGFLCGVAAVVVTILGASLGFDARPVAGALGIAAAVIVIGLMAGYDAWAHWTMLGLYRGGAIDIEEPVPTPVPEKDAIELGRRRALARRIEAQRAARNQSAASGGSVSSADAGRPSQGSSEATTEP